MSRSLRLLYKNAWYHVMNRGAARNTIFHDNNDHQTFIDLLLQTHRRYCFEIHAYCLMPNHYHILINTPLPNLSAGMRHLNGLYAKHYNKKYKRDGPLFRNRYKAILVDAKNYLLRVSRYIHLNPVKAHLAKHPNKYSWSSYRFYASYTQPPDWLYTKETLSYFGSKQQKNKYSLFVLESTDQELESFYRKTKLLPILGSDVFREKISKNILADMIPLKETPDQKKVRAMPNLSSISRAVAKYYHVSNKTLFTVHRSKGNLPRKIAIYLSAELGGKKFNLIAKFFKNTTAAGISKVISRTNKLKISNPAIDSEIKELNQLLFTNHRS